MSFMVLKALQEGRLMKLIFTYLIQVLNYVLDRNPEVSE